MYQAEIPVEHAVGLHARPAAAFVRLASSFPGQVTIRKANGQGQSVNAKSILAVLSLGVNSGDTVAIETDGERAEEALNALVDLIRSNFGEEKA